MTPFHYRLAAAVWLAAALAIAGCGVKERPLPPDAVRPERILDLKAGADKDGIRLSWGRPDRYATGRTMRDLAGFVILRAEGDARPTTLAEIPVSDRERFQKERRFDYVDSATLIGHTYRYQVVSTTDDGYRSNGSNAVKFTRVVPPPPPNPENFVLPKATPLP
jgi:hypothetical protein